MFRNIKNKLAKKNNQYKGMLFGLLVLLLSQLLFSAPVSAGPLDDAKKTDLNRRALFTMKECLGEYFDANDQYTNLDDFFVVKKYPNPDLGDSTQEYVVVGFDRNKLNGVMTCSPLIVRGMKALGYTGSDSEIANEFSKIITGSSLADSVGPIKAQPNRDTANRNALIDRINQELAKYQDPAQEVTAARLYDLLYTCYDLTSDPPTSTQGPNDFSQQLSSGVTVYAKWKGQEKALESARSFIRFGITGGNDPFFGTGPDQYYLGIYHVFSDDGGLEFNDHFYAFGKDLSNVGRNNEGFMNCETAKKQKGLVLAGVINVNNNGKLVTPSGVVETPTPPPANENNGVECESSDVLGWILCPVVTTLLSAADSLAQDYVVPLLKVRPLDSNNQLYDIWKSFRILANIFFVLVFFVIIFSTAINNRE